MSAQSWYCPAVPAPRIGVSACLAGQRVRYDGTDKRSDNLYARIEPYAELVPLCPEASLGTPRPPVYLQQTPQGFRAIGVDDASLDVTEALLAFNHANRAFIGHLCGVILKARSPSCGIGSTPQTIIAGDIVYGSGLLAGFIQAAFPWMPMCDETTLDKPEQARDFISMVMLISDMRQAMATREQHLCLLHHQQQTHPYDAQRILTGFLEYAEREQAASLSGKG